MIRRWFDDRSPSERLLIGIAALLLMVLVVYALAWRPLQHHLADLDRGIAQQRQLKLWLEGTRSEVMRLRRQTPTAGQGAGDRRSLLALVDQTARQAGLGRSIRRVEPNGQDGVRLRFEAVAFDDLMVWLEKIAGIGDIAVEAAAIDRRDEGGLVDARLTLRSRRGGP